MCRFFEFFTSVNGGYDDGYIFRSDVSRIFWERYWAIGEKGGDTN